MGRFIVILVACLAVGTLAYAEDRTISWDSGQCDVFDYNELQGHFIALDLPADWDHSFTQSFSFYGKTYGDVGDLRATVVVMGPQTAETAKIEDAPESLVIYTRKQFRIADYAGPEAGWVVIPLDAVELTAGCLAGIFTHSNDERGLMIGLDQPKGTQSHSSYVAPLAQGTEEDGIEQRTDGRDWMIRLTIRPTLEVQSTVTSAELSGPSFSVYDDGVADDFITMQKYGPVLRVTNATERKVKRVWVYAYVDGDWFNTTRDAAVYLMDSRYAILNHGMLPFSRYTDQPGWGYVSFGGDRMPKQFLVLIEPFSRPDLQLMLGYDSSGANKGSEFGSVGHAELGWPLEIPQATTNWMIRVEYE